MKIRLVFIFAMMFFSFGISAHAQELTTDDLISKIKSIADIDFEQEDRLKPVIGDYVASINKINDLIQKGVDSEVINEKLFKLNKALDLQLKNVLTDDQMHLWDIGKKAIYKEILTTANSQDQ